MAALGRELALTKETCYSSTRHPPSPLSLHHNKETSYTVSMAATDLKQRPKQNSVEKHAQICECNS